MTGDRRSRVRGFGWEYVHAAVDAAFVEVLRDECGHSVAQFLWRALAWLSVPRYPGPARDDRQRVRLSSGYQPRCRRGQSREISQLDRRVRMPTCGVTMIEIDPLTKYGNDFGNRRLHALPRVACSLRCSRVTVPTAAEIPRLLGEPLVRVPRHRARTSKPLGSKRRRSAQPKEW
jgi:hypothetical protein